MSNIRNTQKAELAGKVKLTAVTLYKSPSRKVQAFVMYEHDSQGKAILPPDIHRNILNQMEVKRGDTYTIG